MIGYLYTAVWFLIAAYLIYTAIARYRKPILFLLSGFVVFLGIWELVNIFTEFDMKSGVYGWIYRGVAGVVLIMCLIWYFWLRNRND